MPSNSATKAVKVAGRTLLLAVVILATLCAAIGVNTSPRDPSRVAAIFPPWWRQDRTLAAAATAGEILGVGGATFVVILRGSPADLSSRARSAGALLITSADPSGFCAVRARDSQS
jgi:hypothetical protein